MIFDPRGVRVIEATRNLNNLKPYRRKSLKKDAKKLAKKQKDGRFRCTAVPVLNHRIQKSLMGRKRREGELLQTWR
ncbi:hypothetical protein LCGC14_2419480 [marine sediment metagenome]|uniref:Uncharacterized protein n=1 Tax=marine sediment metagenome TaxID=412755 RepID=A0A0F9BQ57_9ZZZZ